MLAEFNNVDNLFLFIYGLFLYFRCSPLLGEFLPAALKGSGVLSYPERAGGRADKPR